MQFLDNSKRLLRIWLSAAKSSIIREIEFRGNFFAGLFRQLLWLSAFLLFINVTFQNTSSLAGWSQMEVIIILALSRLIEGTMNTLFLSNIMELPELVQKGSFDFAITKPIPTQLYIAFRRVSIDNVGNVIAGFCLLMYGVFHLPTFPSLGSWLSFFLVVGMGITIFYSLLILVASLVFYLDRLEALWGFVSLFTEPLTVPFDVFPRGPRLFITFVIPIAFVVFIPAQAITSRLDWWQLPIGFALTAFFVISANSLWRAGLRRYSSASS